MATVKYLLQSKFDNAPIYLRLSLGRVKGVIKRKIGLNISPKDWSKAYGLPKQNNPTNKNLTNDLLGLIKYILNEVNLASSKGVEITGNWLINKIDLHFERITENKENELISYWINDIIENAHLKKNAKGGIGLSRGRVNGYKRLLDLFKEFEGRKNYKVIDLNKKLFEAFKKWLMDIKKYSPVYSFKNLSDLKTACKEARSNGIETSKEFADLKTVKVNPYDDDMNVITLTPEDIKKIERAKLTNEALINARKWLIIACFTGQRGEALVKRINNDSFESYGKDLVIKIIQKKRNKPVIIPVLPKVKEIFEDGLPYPISTQKLNQYFKKIGEIAKVNDMVLGRLRDKETNRGIKKLRPKYEYISTHIGRRSFASNHYGKLPTPIIMRVTGHTKESTFLGYINQSDDSHIDTFIEYYKTKELKERKESQLTVIKNTSNSN